MPIMIEPNIHPILVHFTYALLTVSALSFLAVAVLPAGPRRDSLHHAANWMMFFGTAAIVATVAAGFQAYYSVAHDGPSHAAMTTHRNWAVPTAIVILGLAFLRYRRRSKNPGLLYAVVFILAAALLSVTAWWGGKLVYVYGLGVKSMPMAEGPGHDHEHGPGEGDDHSAQAGAGEEPSHEHGPGDEPVETEHLGSPDAADLGSKADAAAADEMAQDLSTPTGVVDAFSAALKAGDAALIERLMTPDAVIAEGGGAERSFAEYSGHHMPADMAFVKAVETTVKQRDIIEGHDMATIITASQMHGTYKEKTIHSQTMETMVLRLIDDQWRIAHIHWSSAEIKGEHEH